MGRHKARKAEISDSTKSVKLNLSDRKGMQKLLREFNKTPSVASQKRHWVSCLSVQVIYLIYIQEKNPSELLKAVRKTKDYLRNTKKVKVDKVCETLEALYPIGKMPMEIQALRRFFNFQAIRLENLEYLHPTKVEKLFQSLAMLQKIIKNPATNFVKATKQEILSSPKKTMSGKVNSKKHGNSIMMSTLTPEFHVELFLKSLEPHLNILSPELSEDFYHSLAEAFTSSLNSYNYKENFDFKPS